MANSNTSGGIGVVGLLFVAFVVLKLCNLISWPWIWVLAPLWIPLVLVCAVGLIWLSFLLHDKARFGKRAIKRNKK